MGDLIVRLILKDEDFNKKLNLSKASTKSFGKGLAGTMSGAVAAFAGVTAAIGAVVAGLKKCIEHNQLLGDAWGRTTSGMKAAFNQVVNAVANWDFSNLTDKMKEAAYYGQRLYDAMDALGEMETSYNIQLARQSDEINNLKIALADVNTSAKERLEAGKKLLAIYSQMEAPKTEALGNAMNAQLDAAMQMLGINVQAAQNAGIIDSLRAQFVEFWEWLGKGSYREYNAIFSDWEKAYNKAFSDEGAVNGRKTVEAAITAYYQQQAAYSGETLRIQKQMNTLRYSAAKEMEQEERTPFGDSISQVSDMAKLTADAYSEMADAMSIVDNRIVGDGSRVIDFFERANAAADNLIASLQGGLFDALDELANQLGSGEFDAGTLVKSLLSPLADACISAGMLIMTTGEGLEALKEGLLSFSGAAPIAVGGALVALGTAAKIGLAAIGRSGGNSAPSSSSYATAGSSEVRTADMEMTVHVEGIVKGSDILIAGSSAQSNWNR